MINGGDNIWKASKKNYKKIQSKQWHYKGKFFGEDEEFTNETWALKVSELKSKNI